MLYPAELRGRPRRRKDSLPAWKSEVGWHLALPLFMAVVFALLPPSAAAAATAICPSAGSETAAVAGAVNPETLHLGDGTRLRLAGIDAPAASTASVLAGLAPPGTVVRLAPTADKPDRYGDRHAYVFLPDGRLLQDALAQAGGVRARWLPGEGACFATLLDSERKARQAGAGLWASPDAILAAGDPSLVRRSGLYELVAGRLVSVGHGTPLTFLDFGRDHSRDFTVMLSAPVTRALTATLGSVDSLVGRQLLVRGVIQDNRGPAIRLNDAAEIELIDDAPNR